MARPKEFDVDEVLDKAMEAFWSKGYGATSMAELMEAMDLKKGSIYQTFGDKHSLFIDVLRRYNDVVYANFKEVFVQAETPYEGMRTLLTEFLVEFATGEIRRKGCFTTNTLVELGPHDDEVKEIVIRQKKRMEKLFAEEISKGQKKGCFRKDIKASELAIAVNVVIVGVMADCKTGGFKERTTKVAETFLKTLMN